jgi:hypothetical protein
MFAKTGLKKGVFATFCLTSLIQMLITCKRKIVEDFQRWHEIPHEKIFQKCFKKFIFL